MFQREFKKSGNSDGEVQSNIDSKDFDIKSENCNIVKSLKFNPNLLQKASAAVDLISQKIEFKNLMNQSATGPFVTVILEVSNEFIDQLEKQEHELI